MVLGEPLKAWAQKLLLLKAMLKLGGETTVTEIDCVLEQPFK